VKRIIGQRDARLKKNKEKAEALAKEKKQAAISSEVVREV